KHLVAKLSLPEELKHAVTLAAEWHDLGKRRHLFQRILGNMNSAVPLAKAGEKIQSISLPEAYRHEFGSLIDVLDKDELYSAKIQRLTGESREVVLTLIAAHHGRGRPHFERGEAFDAEPKGQNAEELAAQVPQRFAQLQRKYGRWGLAYLESLLRAADYAASAKPSAFVEEEK